MKATLLLLDIHNLGVSVITVASVITLILIIVRALGKEVGETVVILIHTWKTIRAAKEKLNMEAPAEQPQLLDQTDSKHELGSGAP